MDNRLHCERVYNDACNSFWANNGSTNCPLMVTPLKNYKNEEDPTDSFSFSIPVTLCQG